MDGSHEVLWEQLILCIDHKVGGFWVETCSIYRSLPAEWAERDRQRRLETDREQQERQVVHVPGRIHCLTRPDCREGRGWYSSKGLWHSTIVKIFFWKVVPKLIAVRRLDQDAIHGDHISRMYMFGSCVNLKMTASEGSLNGSSQIFSKEAWNSTLVQVASDMEQCLAR